MITPLDKAKLSNLVMSDTFRVLRQLAEDMISRWQKELGSGSSEFEYLKSCLERDGKIQGVDSFLKEVERYVETNRK